MKLSFINLQRNADAGGQPGAASLGSSSPIMPAGSQTSELVSKLLDANIQRSTTATAQVVQLNVKAISNWRPTSTGLPVVMVVTDKGNFWPLASVVKNQPAAFPQPVVAKATLVPRKDKSGNDVLNISQLEFEPTMDLRTQQMISAMKPGTALFAQ